MRKHFRKPDRWTVGVIGLFVLILGIGAAVAIGAGESTGTNTACATAPDHTVGVDGTAVTTIAGTTACHTETYTIPTVTSTETATSTTTPTTTTTATTPTSGLPAGVTLQPIDGGADYYGSRFSADAAWDDPSFYPLAVFNQTLGYSGSGTWQPSQLAAYKAEGINGFVNLYNGFNQNLSDAITADGMWLIDGPLAPAYAGEQAGFVWTDEPDGNNNCGDIPSATILGESVPCTATSDGRTPSSAIAQVTSDLHGAKGKGDRTRFVYGQYTKPVARNEGLTAAQASAYENAADVISFDYYVINDGFESPNNQLWLQYDAVRNVRAQAGNAKPVLPFIEAGEPFTSTQWSHVTATPAMEVAEAWQAIIGGARGIQWFDHDFGGPSGGYANSASDLIDSNGVFAALQSAVKAFNLRVAGLAAVLNSPFANGYETHTGQMDVMTKQAPDGSFYVFAAPRSTSSQTVTFTTAGGYSGPVTVQGENRAVTATNGVFSDTFAGQTAVHIYQIP